MESKDNKIILQQIIQIVRKYFLTILLFGMTINILMLFMPMYTMQLLDRVMSSGSKETLIMLTVITISAIISLAIIDSVRQFMVNRIGDWFEYQLSPIMVRKSIILTINNPSISAGDLLRDIQLIKSFIVNPSTFALLDLPWSLIYLIFSFMISIPAGIIAVIGIITLTSLAIWNETSTSKIAKKALERNIRNNRNIDTAIKNAQSLESMGMSENIINIWQKESKSLSEMQKSVALQSLKVQGITKSARMILQISAIGVGVAVALYDRSTAGGIIAASIVVGRALAPFESAIISWKQLTNAISSYKRIEQILDAVKDRDISLTLPVPEGNIEFDKVIFSPNPNQRPTIKGVSCKIEKGEAIGIIGPSAAGKSTMIKLIVGIWKPISGSVRLDNADTYRWPREQFGKYIGYLPQSIELFDGSIKQNIARMEENFHDEDVIKAAKIAGVHELILDMPRGYETIISGGGSELSGGQRQRIALARAMYGDIKVLVLDEPNSNLDKAGENQLTKVVEYAKNNNITLVITTHKTQILGLVDKIMIMQNGAILSFSSQDDFRQAQRASNEQQQNQPNKAKVLNDKDNEQSSNPENKDSADVLETETISKMNGTHANSSNNPDQENSEDNK